MSERKTRREIVLFWVSLAALVLFTVIEWLIIRTVSKLTPATSVIFFVVLNINVLIALVFTFLSIRHLLRFFFSRHGKFLGKTLKAKLSIVFPALSIFPTLLIFLVSFFYIHASFDQWFKHQVVESVGDAVELTVYYYDITKSMLKRESARVFASGQSVSEDQCQNFSTDLVHAQWLVVKDAHGKIICGWVRDEKNTIDFERLMSEIQNASSNVAKLNDNEFIFTQTPLTQGGAAFLGAIVPKEYSDKMAKVAFLAQDLKELNPYATPLKSIYTIALIAMTALIIFSSVWIGIRLADRLGKPLLELTQKMSRVKEGRFEKIPLNPDEQAETRVMKESYNQMIENWEETKKQLEEALVSVKQINYDVDIQNKFVELVLDDLDSAILLINSAQEVILHNKEFSNRFGSSTKVKHVSELPAAFQHMLFDFQKKTIGKRQNMSLRDLKEFAFKGGSRTYEVLLRTLVFQEGKDVLYLALLHDLTAVQTEQTLKAWQEVAKRVAHEIKNPLTPVQLMSERLLRKLSREEPLATEDVKETLESTLHHVTVIKDLVTEFSKVASLPRVSPALGMVNTVVDRVREVYTPICLEKNIELKVCVDNNIPPFPYDFNALVQVFQNLIQNAIHAFADQPSKHSKIEFLARYNRKLKSVVFVLDDNGPGINISDVNRIFTPHFSTKEKGMGLGLSISKKLVEDHGGHIQVFSGASQSGTRFVIELPVYRFANKPSYDSAAESEMTV